MCQQAAVTLPVDPRSAGRAREFVGERCVGWGVEGVCDDVDLPVSELVTNALLHSRTEATVTVSLTRRFLEIAVSDGNPRPPVLRPVRANLLTDIDKVAGRLSDLPLDPRDEGLHVGDAGAITAGRGMLIVDAVADEWGVSELAAGKAVWFRVSTPAVWSPPQPCACPQATATTPGGAPFRHADAD